MTQGIFIERDGELVNMQAAAYITEDALQTLLERHSVLLAGDQISTGGVPAAFCACAARGRYSRLPISQ